MQYGGRGGKEIETEQSDVWGGIVFKENEAERNSDRYDHQPITFFHLFSPCSRALQQHPRKEKPFFHSHLRMGRASVKLDDVCFRKQSGKAVEAVRPPFGRS